MEKMAPAATAATDAADAAVAAAMPAAVAAAAAEFLRFADCRNKFWTLRMFSDVVDRLGAFLDVWSYCYSRSCGYDRAVTI